MPQTRAGAMKALAKKRGLSVEQLEEKLKTHSYCYGCETWRPLNEFGVDRSRSNGASRKCTSCRRTQNPKPRRQQPSPFKGKTHTAESRRKMSESRIGNLNRAGKPTTPEQRQYISIRTRQFAVRGVSHPNWRGGISRENELARASLEYQTWRKSVFERDRYTCQKCGDNQGGNLNAHHIKPFSEFPELRFDVNNGLTLCEKCHQRLHIKLTDEDIYLIEIAVKYAFDMFGSLSAIANAFGTQVRTVRKIINREGAFEHGTE